MALNSINDVFSYVDSAGRVQQSEEPGIGATPATPSYITGIPLNPIGPAQQISEPVSPTGLIIPAGAKVARIQNTGTSAGRWRDDGGTLNTQAPFNGQRITPTDPPLVYDVTDLTKWRVVREAPGAVFEIFYYG